MKRKKKSLCRLFVATFVACLIMNSGVAHASVLSENEVRNGVEFLENQDASNDAYNRLLAQFGTQPMGKNAGRQQYPEYYAGAYIGEDGNLVVLTKGANIQEVNALADACNNNSVIFATATYSYNELITVMETFSDRATIAAEAGNYNGVAITFSIRDNENKVFIGVSDLEDTQLLSYLTDGIDPGCYSVYQASELQEMASLVPGDYINGSLGGSAAYKAKLTIDGEEKIGFITAAHVTDGSDVYEGSIHLWGKIGDTIVEQNSGSVDAAFVELTGTNTFSNTINGYELETDVTVIPAIGSTVYKIGAQSGITSGVVYSNLNESKWYINGQEVIFTDLVETSVSCINGDSGGLMYTKSGNTYKIVGIIKGGSSADGLYYATKAGALPWQISIIH